MTADEWDAMVSAAQADLDEARVLLMELAEVRLSAGRGDGHAVFPGPQ